MSIYLGNTEIGQIYLGSTEISEAYIGGTKVFEKGGGSILPSGYTQLEYLENALGKSAYFNTGLKTSNTFGFEVDAMFYDTFDTTNHSLFGGRYADKNRDVTLCTYTSTSANCNGQLRTGGSSMQTDANLAQDVRFTASFIEGVFITSTGINKNVSYSGNHNCNVNVFCQGSLNNTNPINNAHGRIYSLKFYNGSTLVRDFVPCIDPNDVYGMYDLVNNVFYGSAAEDAFTGVEFNNN